MHLLAAALYAGLAAIHLWRTRWRGPVLDQPAGGLKLGERGLLLIALAAHGVSLRMAIFDGDSMRFNFAIAISVMLWLAIAFYWIESFYARMEGLQVIGLPAAAVAALCCRRCFPRPMCWPMPARGIPPAFPDGHAGLQPVHPRRAARPADGDRRKRACTAAASRRCWPGCRHC
jgi:hypothetical protein